jgi:hypothetical protein
LAWNCSITLGDLQPKAGASIYAGLVKKAGDELRPTDQPDMPPLLGSQTVSKDGHVFVDDRNFRTRRLRQRTGQNIILLARVTVGHTKLHRLLIGLPPEDTGVDRSVERTHTVTASGLRAVEPIDGTIRPRDKAIRTGDDVNNEFAISCRQENRLVAVVIFIMVKRQGQYVVIRPMHSSTGSGLWSSIRTQSGIAPELGYSLFDGNSTGTIRNPSRDPVFLGLLDVIPRPD